MDESIDLCTRGTEVDDETNKVEVASGLFYHLTTNNDSNAGKVMLSYAGGEIGIQQSWWSGNNQLFCLRYAGFNIPTKNYCAKTAKTKAFSLN